MHSRPSNSNSSSLKLTRYGKQLGSDIMRQTVRSLVLCIGLLLPSLALCQVAIFKGNVAEFDVPKDHHYEFEEGRQTLSLSLQAPHRVEIRLTFNSLKDYVRQRPTIGKDFIRDSAKKKGKELFDVPGNGGMAFIDFSETRRAGADEIRSTHGMMGLNDAYVTFTVTTEAKNADSPTMKRIFSGGLTELLGRLKSRGA